MKASPGEQRAEYDWAALVPKFMHPMKVAIIEALWRLERPLSASELSKVFDHQYDISHVSHHMTSLWKLNVLRKAGQRRGRASIETFYALR